MKSETALLTETALITGSSSGIGFHLAVEFARRRHALVLIAPVASELQKIAAEHRSGLAPHEAVLATDAATSPGPYSERGVSRWLRARSVIRRLSRLKGICSIAHRSTCNGIGGHGCDCYRPLSRANRYRFLPEVRHAARTHVPKGKSNGAAGRGKSRV